MLFPPVLPSSPVLLYPAILHTSLTSVPTLCPSMSNLTNIVIKLRNTLSVLLKCLRVTKSRSCWEYHSESIDLRSPSGYLMTARDIVVKHRPCPEHCTVSRHFSLFLAVLFCDTVLQLISVPFLPVLICTRNCSNISLSTCREHCTVSRRFSLFPAVILCDTVRQLISVPFLPVSICTRNCSYISLFNTAVFCFIQCNVRNELLINLRVRMNLTGLRP
jgi:hypothetical protein